MMTCDGKAVLFTAALAVMSAQAATYADLIEFTFEGEIDSVSGDIPDPWSDTTIGSLFSVVYVFDSNTPDLLPDVPDEGLYAVEHLSVGIEGIDQAADFAQIGVQKLLVEDRYRVDFFDVLNGDGGDIVLAGVDVFLSDALPLDLDLDDFTLGRSFELIGLDYEIHGSVSFFTRAVVPSPGGVLLLGFSIAFIAQRRMRK
jgi:hypothetical protein